MRENPNRIGSLKPSKKLLEIEAGKTITSKSGIDLDVKKRGRRKSVELVKG